MSESIFSDMLQVIPRVDIKINNEKVNYNHFHDVLPVDEEL
jgi:hypothetical protein